MLVSLGGKFIFFIQTEKCLVRGARAVDGYDLGFVQLWGISVLAGLFVIASTASGAGRNPC